MEHRRPHFRHLTRNQRSLFWAQLVESVGNFGLVYAFTLWATTTGGSAATVAQLVSWVILVNTAPRVLLSPVVARVCGRVPERRVLLVANLVRAIICGVGLLGARPSVATTLAWHCCSRPPTSSSHQPAAPPRSATCASTSGSGSGL